MDVEGTVNHAQLGKTHASSNDFAHDAVIPNFYLSHQLNEQMALGFALGTNYGMKPIWVLSLQPLTLATKRA